jgi:hypothetical protein
MNLSVIKEHPVEALLLGGVALVALYYLFAGSGGSSNPNAAVDAAYFQATAQQAQAGDALQAVQIQTQGQTDLATIAANASQANNTTWANTDLSITQSNNQAATAAAPYAAEESLYNALEGVASLPGSTETVTSKSTGFFGLGGGSKTTSTYVPNPAATAAGSELASLVNYNINNGFYAGS